MTDLVTIGTLAASALAMASEEAVKGFVGEAAKDTYKALRNKLARWAGADVDALEKAPSSAARLSVVAEAVDGQPPEERASVKALVVALVEALKSEAQKSGGAGPVGLYVHTLEALKLNLGAIDVTDPNGKGAIFGQVRTGALTVKRINVGPPPGKTER